MDRKLPIGIQDFQKLRGDGYVYVDKTAYVYSMASLSTPFFLSRPRRFGKSLLVSTLKYYFQGRHDLFEGLAIERLEGKGDGAWQPRPVFHLDFDGANYAIDALEEALNVRIGRWEEQFGISREEKGFGDRLRHLLEAAHAASGHRCVVLVDEYDKPLLDAMDDPERVEHNRAVLKGLYSALKEADAHLRFVLVTGVTKFSKVSIFSDLNNLRDITLSGAYAAVCGVTESELVQTFAPELDAFAERRGTNRDGCVRILRGRYDGYCFHSDGPGAPEGAASKVCNPFSLLNALVERRLGSWWFQSGTPNFLVRQIADSRLEPKRLADGSIWASEERLSDYRFDDPDPVPLLFQAGYLTIGDIEEETGEYCLVIPNEEVRSGLTEALVPAYAPGYSGVRGTDVFSLRHYVRDGDLDGIRDVLVALFASIPYTQEANPFEHYFQAVICSHLPCWGATCAARCIRRADA